MTFEKGNQLYKIRTIDGRDKLFSTPEKLAEVANEYFQFVLDNPFIESSVVGKAYRRPSKDDKEEKESLPYVIAELPKMRPMTIGGFCNYAEISIKTFYNYSKYPDFVHITTRIIQIIENHQLEGATSGFFNANIIARKLGLADKQDITTREEQPLFPDTSEEESEKPIIPVKKDDTDDISLD